MKTLPVCFLTTVLCLGCRYSSNTQPAPPTGEDKPSGENEGNPKEILAALQQLGTAFHDFESSHRVLPAAEAGSAGGSQAGPACSRPGSERSDRK